ncbi:MAG TPA: MerR family transcriptional regulator [bacterium]|nr:MerR family transcriptional regulator [bacterium]
MDSNKKTYYIGDISQELGLSQRTVRYYEELGFIRPARTEGGFRTYSGRDVDVIRCIVQFKELGMTLEEIGSLFSPGAMGPSSEMRRQLRETLLARRGEIEARMKSLEKGIRQIERVLEMLSECSSCGHGAGELCQACLEGRAGELSPIINPLLSAKPQTKE